TILPYKNHNLSSDIVISPCPRQDLSYPIHINIHNKISLLSSKTHMFAVLTSEKILNTLNDSLATVNSVTDQFFIS
ncbi:MAG TPA: hypothetical protein PJ990_07720, partial [Saprospiraceae bacterium]|nr:hypothetical protein [Saprospiraceae bacterium]